MFTHTQTRKHHNNILLLLLLVWLKIQLITLVLELFTFVNSHKIFSITPLAQLLWTMNENIHQYCNLAIKRLSKYRQFKLLSKKKESIKQEYDYAVAKNMLCFISWSWKNYYYMLLQKMHRPALGTTQATTQWVTWVVSLGSSSQGMRLINHLHLLPRLRISGTILPLPH